MVSVTLPPAGTEADEKLLETVGGDKVTKSASTAEQAPVAATQLVAVLVLLTEAGGVITAVLVTAVWAKALGKMNAAKSKASMAEANA